MNFPSQFRKLHPHYPHFTNRTLSSSLRSVIVMACSYSVFVWLALSASVAHTFNAPRIPATRTAALQAVNYDKKKLSGARSKFVNAEGRLFAPWLEQQVDDEGMKQARVEREKRLEAQRRRRARDGTGAAELEMEGLASELGGGGMRLAAKVLEAPATADHHGHVQVSWANAGGNLAVEKKAGGAWVTARGATSPVVDAEAAAGDALYRVKNGGNVVAQVGCVVQSKDEQSSNALVLGGLGAALVAFAAFSLTLDAIPSV